MCHWFWIVLSQSWIESHEWINKDIQLTMEDAHGLASQHKIAADEYIISDNPLLLSNLRRHLANALADKNTWEAISLLKAVQGDEGALTFEVLNDSVGKPIAIVVMSLAQHEP